MRRQRRSRSTLSVETPREQSRSLVFGMRRRLLLRSLLLLTPIVWLTVRAVRAGRTRLKAASAATVPHRDCCSSSTSGGSRSGVILSNIANVHLQPELLIGGKCGGRDVVAFAITLTKDGSHLDGAVVLAASIDSACGQSEFLCDLVAFLHDDIGQQSEAILTRLGFRVMRPGLPLDLNDIQDTATRERVKTGGCCGPAELMKLFAYTLTEYHRVVHLDTDTLVLQPLDPILNGEESLLYTTDLNMANKRSSVYPVQGGFLVVRPDRTVFDDLVEVLKWTPFTRKGWGGTGIGLFWGGITVQGLLPYYYEHRAAPGVTYRAVDRCVYNTMADTDDCKVVDVETIRSAHFTNCQKPWTCAYPHPKNKLCTKLMERWFLARERAETALGLLRTQACLGNREVNYKPMLALGKQHARGVTMQRVEAGDCGVPGVRMPRKEEHFVYRNQPSLFELDPA